MVNSAAIGFGNYRRPLAVHDMDGDGLPEIAVGADNVYGVLEHDLSVKWTAPVLDGSGYAAGTAFELTPTLLPLARVRDRMTVVTGLSNLEAAPKDNSAGNHARGNAAWLSGSRCKHSQDEAYAAKTVDQYAADVLGADTPLRSLEMGIESNTFIASCESGYSCVYESTFSWRTPSMPLFRLAA